MIYTVETAATWVSFIFSIISLIVYVVTLFFTLRKAVKDFKADKDSKFSSINDKLEAVEKNIVDLRDSQNKNERDRLKDIIIEFADKIIMNRKKGEDIFELNQTNFEHVFRTYAKYKSLGGNGYIDAEMELIQEEFKNRY